MQAAQKKEPLKKNDPGPYTFSDQVTSKKMKKHLSDINDVITEEDIKNVKIPGDETTALIPETKEESGKIAEDDSLTEGKPITPWDIIEE